MSTKRLYEIFYEVSRTVNSSLDPGEVLNRIAEQVTRAMGVKGCFIRLLDRSGKVLKPAAQYGLSERYTRKGVVEVAKSGLDREAFTGKVVQIADAASDPRFQYGQEAAEEGLVSVLVAPLFVEGSRPIGHMRAGRPHVFERTGANGKVIELRGQALPGGGYVTSYNDITDFKRAEQALLEANETLEQRVAERSQVAEAAQQSKTRFLAAISHDVLQPLNAARLFASALRDSLRDDDEQRHLAERVDASLRAAEELLDGLLDVSRLDAGGLHPTVTDFDAAVLVRELAAQYTPIAAGRGLRLHVHARTAWVRSDRRLLRRVLQNFMANALRYTRSGRIVLALRVRGEQVELQVWDTGPGIPEHHMQQIFDEFHRYQQPFDWGEQGLGLGLSICQRISRLLGHALDARSEPGRGSMFSITLPKVAAPATVAAPRPSLGFGGDDALAGLRVLCVDNDHEILDGMRALLGRWKVQVITADTVDMALEKVAEKPDVVLVDYHLHDRLDGLSTLVALREAAGRPLPGALLTADGRDELKRMARERGYRVLTKPVKPASLRAFLTALR